MKSSFLQFRGDNFPVPTIKPNFSFTNFHGFVRQHYWADQYNTEFTRITDFEIPKIGHGVDTWIHLT